MLLGSTTVEVCPATATATILPSGMMSNVLGVVGAAAGNALGTATGLPNARVGCVTTLTASKPPTCGT